MQTTPLFLLELIDTLWNVNSTIIKVLKNVPLELIDTLWNVNVAKWLLHDSRNRN